MRLRNKGQRAISPENNNLTGSVSLVYLPTDVVTIIAHLIVKGKSQANLPGVAPRLSGS